jgi:hypothetical protein
MAGPRSGQAFRPPSLLWILALCTVLAAGSLTRSLPAAEIDRSDLLQGEAVAVRECGRCHRLEPVSLGIAGSTVFADQVRQADWDSLPLRVWLDTRHKPRVPEVHLSEADADDLTTYLEWLRQVSKAPLDIEEIEEPTEAKTHKPQVPLPPELMKVPKGATVKPPRCVNCYPTGPEPLNRP